MSSGRTARSEAEQIATAVLDLDVVSAMSSGPMGQFRSYLPGGDTVPGVRLDEDSVEINIVTRYGPALPAVGQQVARAVRPWRAGREVIVTIDDVLLPDEPDPDGADSIVQPGTSPESAHGDESDPGPGAHPDPGDT